MKIWKVLFQTAACAGVAASVQLGACTAIKLAAQDGSTVHGRTAEFGLDLQLSLVAIPAGISFEGTTPQGKGLQYTSKYGAVGAMTFDNPVMIDGINEKGLAVGAFYFPGYAAYSKTTSENQSQSLSPLEFPNWILTNFATVEEVKSGIAGVAIAPTVIEGWGSESPPLHYIVYDKAGKSIVIEPLEGKLVVRDSPMGIITNSPTFDWHQTNLRNYVGLSPYNPKAVTVDDLKLNPFGQGSGMVGLPGDFSPPSRFVRATAYSALAIPSKNSDEAVLQAFHILNQFDIPVGFVRAKVGDKTMSEWTLATTVRDPKNLKYYMRTYADQTIRAVDVKQVTQDSKAIKRLKLDQYKQPIVDVSSDLKNAR